MPLCDDIFSKVSAVLMESLNVDKDAITPTSTLHHDLGAESIDFLDIVFRLEREFSIKIPRGELFPESIFRGDPEFVQNGKVTEKGLAELHARLPFADLGNFEKDPLVGAIPDLFTAGLIARYVERKIYGWVVPESALLGSPRRAFAECLEAGGVPTRADVGLPEQSVE